MAFVVKIDELNGAASDYSKAASEYDSAYTSLISDMNIQNSSWSDEAGEKWRAITTKAKDELSKIKTNLDSNNKLLTEVAQAANATQQKVQTGIDNIYS